MPHLCGLLRLMAVRKLFVPNMKVQCMVFVIASMSLIITVAQDDPQTLKVGEDCSGDAYRYTNETAFQNNLDTAFASLGSNISSSNNSFFATSFSNNGNTDGVYALLLCRKYLTSEECLQCFTAAKEVSKESCSSKGYNGGRIHLDGCLLRYENSTFFEENKHASFSNYCASLYHTNRKEFNETAEILLSQLITNASRSDGYAVGVVSKGSTFAYGVAQCAPTLSNATCQECLKAAQILVSNCLPKEQGRGPQPGCFMRYATTSFYDNFNSTTPNSPTTSSNKKSKIWPILLGSIGGASLFVVLCSVFIWGRFFDRFKRYFRGRYLYTESEEHLTTAETFEQVIFEYDVLRGATENFDMANLVGKGEYGEVYKGTLVNGREIAVKKSSEKLSSKATEDFLTEVKLISTVRHRNLVRLLGCCVRGHERFLVYEFMSNNSLDKHLFGDKGNHLDWETRLKIIVGTARGLAYLHEYCNIRIVHRDIKAANILLDDKFNAKIADFGLAKVFSEGETHVSTNFAAGTIGYTAPEYAVHGQLSEKSDVYSYGVLVLEIVCGRKCINQRLPAPLQLLLEWAWTQYQRNEGVEIVDVRIKEYPRKEVLKVIKIALLCCQASPVERPTMSGVVSMLTTGSEINVGPTQPGLTDAGVTTWRPSSWASASTSTSDSAQSRGTMSVSLVPR